MDLYKKGMGLTLFGALFIILSSTLASIYSHPLRPLNYKYYQRYPKGRNYIKMIPFQQSFIVETRSPIHQFRSNYQNIKSTRRDRNSKFNYRCWERANDAPIDIYGGRLCPYETSSLRYRYIDELGFDQYLRV
uniref:Uncharacterized protein n=1 Tax=Lepeophtheirus salmonis TaxID=72036 RepID=A0A0K2T6R0_LEPSM